MQSTVERLHLISRYHLVVEALFIYVAEIVLFLRNGVFLSLHFTSFDGMPCEGESVKKKGRLSASPPQISDSINPSYSQSYFSTAFNFSDNQNDGSDDDPNFIPDFDMFDSEGNDDDEDDGDDDDHNDGNGDEIEISVGGTSTKSIGNDSNYNIKLGQRDVDELPLGGNRNKTQQYSQLRRPNPMEFNSHSLSDSLGQRETASSNDVAKSPEAQVQDSNAPVDQNNQPPFETSMSREFQVSGRISIPAVADVPDNRPPSTFPFINAPQNPIFEIDNLDSSGDDDPSYEQSGPSDSSGWTSDGSSNEGSVLKMSEKELQSVEVQQRPNSRTVFPSPAPVVNSLTSTEDTEKDGNDVNSSEHQAAEAEVDDDELDAVETPNTDYIQFLTSLLIDNKAGEGTSTISSDGKGLSLRKNFGARNDTPCGTDASAQDDDDDFDYLRESANVQDDPLEYRDDLTVPVKEVLHLLGDTDNARTLRPQTRGLKPRKGICKHRNQTKSMKVKASIPATPVPLLPAGHSQAQEMTHGANYAIPASNTELETKTGPSQGIKLGMPNMLAIVPGVNTSGIAVETVQGVPKLPLPIAYVPLSPDKLLEFKQQLTTHVQIATHIHFQIARKRRTESVKSDQGLAEGDDKRKAQMSKTEQTHRRTGYLLRRLIAHGRTSNSFHDLLAQKLRVLHNVSNQILGNGYIEQCAFDSWRLSVIDSNLIEAVSYFLHGISRRDWDGTDSVLKYLEKFMRNDISVALRRKALSRQQSGTGGPNPLVWSSEDDVLLAMTVAKYGRDFGDKCRDLLPHRNEEDCQVRVRYLSSRRCADNAVKRQVLLLSTPLNRIELQMVNEGLQKLGDPSKPETWKRLQREYLPGREWFHLQKLWTWRESRRRYKAKYRARSNEKK